MKVKLIKDLGRRKAGTVVTMHPVNARHWYKVGVCVALSREEDEYLAADRVGRVRRVETTMRDRATEEAVVVHPVEPTSVEGASGAESQEPDTKSYTKPRGKKRPSASPPPA